MGEIWQRLAPRVRHRVPAPLYRRWRSSRIWLSERRVPGGEGVLLSELRSALGPAGDLRVLAGPFDGMRYAPASAGSELIPKLLGTYELELHPAVEDLVASGCAFVVNVGCGEGYYAVGLARRMPDTTVLAFDIDPEARRLCSNMAALNGVSERVKVGGAFASSDLTPDLVEQGLALVIDCEGCENELLNPQRFPILRSVAVLVELHDFVHPGIASRMRETFAPTHDLELIPARRRLPATHPMIAALGRRAARVAVDERRPPGMCWAVLIPRDGWPLRGGSSVRRPSRPANG